MRVIKKSSVISRKDLRVRVSFIKICGPLTPTTKKKVKKMFESEFLPFAINYLNLPAFELKNISYIEEENSITLNWKASPIIADALYSFQNKKTFSWCLKIAERKIKSDISPDLYISKRPYSKLDVAVATIPISLFLYSTHIFLEHPFKVSWWASSLTAFFLSMLFFLPALTFPLKNQSKFYNWDLSYLYAFSRKTIKYGSVASALSGASMALAFYPHSIIIPIIATLMSLSTYLVIQTCQGNHYNKHYSFLGITVLLLTAVAGMVTYILFSAEQFLLASIIISFIAMSLYNLVIFFKGYAQLRGKDSSSIKKSVLVKISRHEWVTLGCFLIISILFHLATLKLY